MRNKSILMSLLVIAAMLLAACGGEETSTSAPGTDVPPITAESTATDDMTSTEPAGTADPNATADTTTTPGVPVTGEDSPSRLSNLLDLDVWNQDGEQIGEVEDMVLDFDNSNIPYVIVGTGGFLDIGEREVLVPWNSLQVDVAGGQENAFILQTDQETFNNAPDIDLDAVIPDVGTAVSDWDTDIRNYWESGVLPSTTPAPDGTAVPEMTATVEATAQAPGQNQGQGQAADLQGVMLASEALGSNITIGGSQAGGVGVGQATVAPDATAVTTPEGTATASTGDTGSPDNNVDATIDDIIVDPETGDILYLVIDAALTDGERWIPVSFGALQWDADNNAFVIKADANALRNAPFFEEGQYPDTTVEGWDAEFDTFWQNPIP